MKTTFLRVLVAVASFCMAAMVAGAVANAARPLHLPAQSDGWQTYTADDAAYAFDYPPGADISTSDDASLRFKMVYVEFTVSSTTDYQGISVMVLENPQNLPLQQFINAQYRTAGLRPAAEAQRAVALQIKDRQALKLERDKVIGNLDKYTVLIPGDGVVYRVNLYGGGVGGPVEPAQDTQDVFDRVVNSFRVLEQPLKPKQSITAPIAAAADPPVAEVFTYPLRSGAGVNYGVPVGIVHDDTHMEWLGYGIRNLDQWGIKCYGVDWARMIHTGEDWYRLDGANTAGTPVYAIADGVVALQSPGISYPGNVVMIRHRLPDGSDIYSMYGHVTNVSVVQGQQVRLGQQIATVIYQRYTGRTPGEHPSYDSHMHFELRHFLNGTNIYVPGTNAYNYNYPGCTYAYPGRGYTYIIHPDNYPYPGQGYMNPSAFIGAHLGQEGPPVCTQVELLQDRGFENGLPGTPWLATNSLNRVDPLIYRYGAHAGRWAGWLGNVLNYTDTLAQPVDVPTGTHKLTLSFWRYVRSAEPAGSAADQMVVLLSTPQGQIVGSPLIVTTTAVRNRWVLETVVYDVAAYAGQSLTLSLTGFNNGSNVSSFFLDDFSLMTQCP